MADGPRNRATIRDVATLAGVTAGTVSKALSGRGQVSAETRARILAAAKEIDFRPNELARSVFERRSFTVGMITTDSFERFSVPVMLGAEDALGFVTGAGNVDDGEREVARGDTGDIRRQCGSGDGVEGELATPAVDVGQFTADGAGEGGDREIRGGGGVRAGEGEAALAHLTESLRLPGYGGRPSQNGAGGSG